MHSDRSNHDSPSGVETEVPSDDKPSQAEGSEEQAEIALDSQSRDEDDKE